jgi:hypothetical protein
MCVPLAAGLGIASLVTSLAGAGMSAYSQYQSAQYNAQVARNNQITANRNASIALQQGTVQEENQRLKTGAAMGAMEAQEAASGVNPDTGSSLNTRASLAETGELDALTIRYNANLQNWNMKNQANAFGAQASLDQAQGGWGVASSILGGASSVSGKWLQYNQTGVFGNGGSGGGANMDAIAAGVNNALPYSPSF